ncbi:30S ribosomal protein S8 [Candidatus Woesearchaeota archaeon]|nr:MAG: 30S ribosomal protein S8 [Candidatus Woesearchaeota archaeon]
MAMNDPMANILSHIQNYEKIGRKEVLLNHSSNVIKEVLRVLNENSYIGDFEEIDNGKGGLVKLNLLNNVNKCGVIKPNFQIKKVEFDKFEKRFLPAKGFGILIVSTSQGIMTNEQAKEKGIGGKLLAYCY